MVWHREVHCQTAICNHLTAHIWLHANGDAASMVGIPTEKVRAEC